MPRKPNYDFERREREKAKAEKAELRAKAKAEKKAEPKRDGDAAQSHESVAREYECAAEEAASKAAADRNRKATAKD